MRPHRRRKYMHTYTYVCIMNCILMVQHPQLKLSSEAYVHICECCMRIVTYVCVIVYYSMMGREFCVKNTGGNASK